MAGPWEKYQPTATQGPAGPWAKYATQPAITPVAALPAQTPIADAVQSHWTDNLRDPLAGVLKIGPTAIKGVADIARLVTNDSLGVDTSNAMQRGMRSIDDTVGSDRLRAQKAAVSNVMQSDDFGVGDIPGMIADNPRAAIDAGVSTIGSMFLPTGVAAGAVRALPSVAKVLPAAGRLAPAGVATGATVGTGAAMNAAETFADTEGQHPADRYKGAAISGAASLALGKLLGGGAEGLVARRLAGELGKDTAAEIAKSAAKTAVKEGVQEFGEEGSNTIGKQVGKREDINLNAALKSGAYGAAIGAGIGGGTDVATNARALQNAPAAAPEIDPNAPPVAEPATQRSALSDRLDALASRMESEGKTTEAREYRVQAQEARNVERDRSAVDNLLKEARDAEATQPTNPAQAGQAQGAVEGAAGQGVPAAGTPSLETTGLKPKQEGPVLQNRDRSTPSSVAQMQSIAADPDYGRLGYSRDFANGAPVVAGGQVDPQHMGTADMAVASDGRRIPVQYAVVEADTVLPSNTVDGSTNAEYASATDRMRAIAGNGRIAGLQAAAQRGTTTKYRQELAADTMHGIDPQVIAGMRAPVLVRVMPQDQVSSDIGDVSNTTGNLQLSAVEQANNDRQRVDLSALEFSEDGGVTAQAVRQFVQGMPQSERGALLDTNGQPTKQAVDRLHAAVFSRAYGNDQLVRLYAQAQDPEARLILSALAKLAPKFARLEGAGALDIRSVVTEAAEIAVNARRNGTPLAQAAQQIDMAADPLVGTVLQLFARNPRSNREVIEQLGNVADMAYAEANKPAEDMFGAVPRATRGDVLNQLEPQRNEQASPQNLEQPAGPGPVQADDGRPATAATTPSDGAAAQAGGATSTGTGQDADYLAELFGGGDDTPANPPKGRGRVDLALLVPKLRAFSAQKLDEANDWASRQYKGNRGQIHLRGDGPTKSEFISISGANESRRNRNVDALQKQAQMASNLANRIENGRDVNVEIERAIDNAENGRGPFIGETLNDRIEAYISNSLLGDDGYAYGSGSLSRVIREAYEAGAKTESTDQDAITSYTPEEVAARQDAQAKAQQDQARDDREAEQRAQADREVGEFTLTGSDRAADANANQGDIFSAANAEPAPPVGTSAFARWFGKSKMVDGNGKPLVMYHGTTWGDITEFRPAQAGAIFFTEDPAFANEYTLRGMGETAAENEATMLDEGHTPTMMPVYVKAENPFDMDNAEHLARVVDKVFQIGDVHFIGGENKIQMDDDSFWTREMLEYMLSSKELDNWQHIENEQIQKAIRASGFDSFYVMEDGRKNIGVYSPSQVKSATGNSGAFDPANPDIRYSESQGSTGNTTAAVTQALTARFGKTIAAMERRGFLKLWDSYAQFFESNQGAQGRFSQSARFSEDNRLSNLNPNGASWQRIRENNPALRDKSADDEITIYRATIGDTIRPDDFVAVDKSTLRTELRNVRARDGKDAKIISQKVKVRDLLMGNDATEFVYFPQQFSQASGVQGMYDGKTVHLFADGIARGDEVGVFLHEAGEHASMEAMLGDRYAGLVARANELVAEGDADALAAQERIPADTAESARDSELVAYMIETVANKKPLSLTAKARRWLADVVAGVRAWWSQTAINRQLEKYGQGIELTPADIAALAERAVYWQDNQAQAQDGQALSATEAESQFSQGAQQSSADVSNQIEADFPGVKLDMFGRAGSPWNLSRIVVPSGARESGTGTQVMQRVIDAADRAGATVVLTPSADFGGNKSRLTAFYKRFGFVENKGRNKDYEISESMYRLPSEARLSKKSTAARDAEYMAAVEAGDMVTAQRLVNEAAEAAGYSTSDSYRMQHRAPNSEDDVSLADMRDSDLVPADYWTKPRMYLSDPREFVAHSKITDLFRQMDARKANGKDPAGARMTVYRAIPKNVKDSRIRNGDWITPSESYARDEGAMIPEGFRVISQVVTAGQLYWDGNSAAELGYDDGKTYGYKNTKNNRKLLEAVTRDDDGNVIPLNKRFNSRNDDVRFSKARSTTGGNASALTQTAAAPWNVTEPGTGDAVIRAMQNNKIDLKLLRDELEKQYGQLSDKADAYLNEELYHGKVAARVEALHEDVVKPILGKIAVAGKNAGVTVDDVNLYLHSRHAAERNAAMKAINPNMANNDALSGMSDQEAASNIARLRADGKLGALQTIATDIDNLIADTRTNLVADGLESAAVVQAWEGAYQHYVPLQRDVEGQGGGASKGMGFSVKGPEAKRAMGSNREVVNIFANIVAQAETGLIRAEKTKVGRSLLELANQFPNKDFWQVDTPPTKPRINKDTGLVERNAIDPLYQTADNVVMVKDNGGEVHYIVFNERNERAAEVARALKNLGIEKTTFITRMVGNATRFLAMYLTARNPEFWLTNFARDIQAAMLQLEGSDAKGLQTTVAKNIPLAMAGTRNLLRGDGQSQWAKYAKEMKEAGGTTGYMQSYESSDARMGDLIKEVERMQQGKADPRRLGRAALEFIDNYSEVVENGVRLAVYQAARDNGASVPRAASIAKNITVNFNRKGNMSPGINAWYMFFNAGIQGSTALVNTLKTLPKNRKVQGFVGGMATLGFLLDAFNRSNAGDDDENGRNRYDMIPEHEKNRNWIFMQDDGTYKKFPMPLGWSIIPNVGRMLSEATGSSDPKKASEYALSMGMMVIDSFSPIGTSSSVAQLALPSIIDPVVQIQENKNFMGSSVYKSGERAFGPDDPNPAYTRHFESTPEIWKQASKVLNDITGGDDVKKGAVNIEPDILKHIAYTLTGGPGRAVDKVIDSVQAEARGQDVNINRYPFASRFAGEVDDKMRDRVFYDDRKRIEEAKAAFDNAIKKRRRDLAIEVAKELGDGDYDQGMKMMRNAKGTNREIMLINKRIKLLREKEQKGENVVREMSELQKRRTQAMSRNTKRNDDEPDE